MNNSKIVSSPKKIIISLFLSIILVTGILALSSSFMINAQAQPLYTNNYKSKDTNVDINKIKCINDNININGENTADVNIGNKKGQVYLGANSYGGSGYDGGEGYDNNKQGKGFDDCIINNNNTNTNIVSTIPEPTTASLTVKKEIFGCNIIEGSSMECDSLVDNSPSWLACTDPAISGTTFCQNLPANLFDIQVLDDQNTQIQQFEGSAQGTTIQNLQSGTYTVNEIKHQSHDNQLGESDAEEECKSAGFEDAGLLINTNVVIGYQICFEYEDEQGNDCSTITLAAGEDKICIVKNYIRNGQQGGA
ncbi:MAG TPA: hypothetical protein VFM28_02230 [Nitrososphaeraceae archaeon]|nr:hypothetical protein [Nitrososphaeraceae archaeon]